MKIEDAIIGFAIGDALGVPAEFKTREELRRYPITDMVGYGTYNIPKGNWSDDTSLTLATMDSIIQKKKIDTNDIADKFLRWFRNGEYTSNGKAFDIGRTTMQALAQYELKLDEAKMCGQNGEWDNGNGSLMRMLPIVYYIYLNNLRSDDTIYQIVKDVSSITHRHEISILGCYIYVKFVLELFAGRSKAEAYKNIQNFDYSRFGKETVDKYSRIINEDISKQQEEDIKSTGYIVDTLEAVLWLFLNSNDYNTTILKAVNLGQDTDTVAACTGGLLGIYYGASDIKQAWIKDLQRYEYVLEMCRKFDKISEMNNLFYEWKKAQENEEEPCYTPGVVEKHYFTLDGFINKEKYDIARKKILFILKEPHIHVKRERGEEDNQINWYMNYLEWLDDINTKRINDLSYIRENIARMSAYIMNKEIVSDRARLKNALESIAVININKRGGPGDCDTRELYESYYLKYRQFVIDQIEICEPDIIISMCGHEIFDDLEKVFSDRNIKMVSLVHPARGMWIKRKDGEIDKGFRECVKVEEVQNESIENKVKFLNENISSDIKFNKSTFKFFMHFVKRFTDKEIK